MICFSFHRIFILESRSHPTTNIDTTDSKQLPKPTPRLKKSSTNDTNNSSISSQVDDSSISSSSQSHTLNNLKSENETEQSDVQSGSEGVNFKQKKQFWENFEHPILPAPVPRPRIAKSQKDSKDSKDSFDTEMSSLRSSREISRDEEERLEDESFPISDRYDSDASEKTSQVVQTTTKITKITDMDKIEVCESSVMDDGTKFYIGESSTNVIRKTASDKRSEFAFDNQGYQYSLDTEEGRKQMKDDFVHQDIDIYDDTLLSGKIQDTKEELDSHLMAHSTGDDLMLEEKSEFEISEKLSRQQSEEIDALPLASSRPPVVHSPIKNVTVFEKPLEIAGEHITKAKASAIEVLKDFEEPKKPIKLEKLPETQLAKENFRLETVKKNTEAEIQKTLEEVDNSLSAVQDELIEVVKDGKLIKQSPSEFEIKILPDLKYPASIPEQEELPDTPKKEPSIKIKEPEILKLDRPKQSETEESQHSSNEDSFNKLDVIHRTKSKAGSNRWSATDIESSSESHYQSFEKTDSRPLSSDVENLVPTYQSSEYETAQGQSIVSGSTTLDYHSAASTLNSHTISSRDSMKSLDSESSGNLASIEASEASETLVPSTMEECEEALNTDVHAQELDMDKYSSLESEVVSKSEEISPAMVTSATGMKRSHEMNFAADFIDPTAPIKLEEKLGKSVEDLKYGSWEEPKFGSSLEEGSMLSVSISSASNLETMVELNAEQADQLMGSLVGSYDSAKIYTSFTDDASGMTPPEYEASPRFESMTMTTTTVYEDDQNNVNTQITTNVEEQIESMRKRGHKRTDSTSVAFAGGFVKAGSKESGSDSFEEDIVLQEDSSDVISSEKDETHGESSDSDYDRFETEYARSYRLPGQSKSKGKEITKDVDEKLFSSPGHSIIETIVEDIHAEIEHEGEHVIEVKKSQEYDIPNIQVTDDIPKETTSSASQSIQYAKQVEYKMSEEEYHDLLEKKYKSRLADITATCDDNIYEEDQQPSPGSDSFEMLNEPDLSDEFVIVEEVAKEAHEFDQEGKSVSIQSTTKKYIRKHDEEMEKYIVKSAPAATDAGSSFPTGFEFEESPPQDEDNEEPLRGNGYALEGRKGWVEMNLSDPSNLRYPYDMEPRGGILEDIKEEDTDFEVGSSRISSFKDSYSSTPDYDALVRKLHAREHDNLSMNSLQEFESLEHVISLENRRQQTQSSQESLSNGSYPKRGIPKSVHGDDISLSSLKEFEGLENACLEAHLLEIRAKEEAALLLSRSDDSNKSSGSSTGAKSSPKTTSSSPSPRTQQVTTVTTVTSITKGKPSQLEQQMAQEFQKLQQRAQEIMEDKSISIMETSTDSLEEKVTKQIYDKTSSQHVSSDSLDRDLKSGDIMTSSIDSIENSKGGERTGKSSDVDSIEQSSPIKRRSDSIDSIELQFAASQSSKMERDSIDEAMNIEMSSGSGSSSKKVITKTTTTGSGTGGQTVTTIVSTVTQQYDMPQHKDISCDSLNARDPELLLTSTESLTSSTATNATYTNEADSQMSGSITSCGSNTMIEMDPNFYSPSSSSHQIHQQQQQQVTTTTTTTSYSYQHSDLLDDDFAPISFTVKKPNQ